MHEGNGEEIHYRAPMNRCDNLPATENSHGPKGSARIDPKPSWGVRVLRIRGAIEPPDLVPRALLCNPFQKLETNLTLHFPMFPSLHRPNPASLFAQKPSHDPLRGLSIVRLE